MVVNAGLGPSEAVNVNVTLNPQRLVLTSPSSSAA